MSVHGAQMRLSTLRDRIGRLFEHSWRTWLLAGVAAIVVADAAYHLFGADSETETRISPPTAEVPRNTALQAGAVRLTALQQKSAGIVVRPVGMKPHAEIFRAPGEVQVNGYATSNVSTRVRASIISRQARLGDEVRKGQVLVTLYSPEMAEAASAFVLATRNYARAIRLKPYIAGQQFDEAEVKRDELHGRLLTYGLSTTEIANLARDGLANRPAGQFKLSTPQSGIITADTFRSGEVVEPDKPLFEISDLSRVWVEAQVSPAVFPRIAGDNGRVVGGGRTHAAKIIQKHEVLSETTRTIGVRLQVENTAGALKPGAYVDVELFSKAEPELLVPTAAVLRDDDGSWLVYSEKSHGVFRPVRVKPLHAAGDHTVVTGVAAGTKVVTAGAFFLKSEAGKSGFAAED